MTALLKRKSWIHAFIDFLKMPALFCLAFHVDFEKSNDYISFAFLIYLIILHEGLKGFIITYQNE